MKIVTLLLTLLCSLESFATNKLKCRTEKEEVDPSESYYMAGDSNQRINLELKESKVKGKDVLISTAKQLLQYKFSQSSGGESPWSMLVDKVVVDGKDIYLGIAIKRARKNVYRELLKLKVYEGEDSMVAILNKKLAIDGEHVIYNGTEEDIRKIFETFGKLIQSGQLKKNDLVYLQIANCRLITN